jgi:hypothetical protein
VVADSNPVHHVGWRTIAPLRCLSWVRISTSCSAIESVVGDSVRNGLLTLPRGSTFYLVGGELDEPELPTRFVGHGSNLRSTSRAS